MQEFHVFILVKIIKFSGKDLGWIIKDSLPFTSFSRYVLQHKVYHNREKDSFIILEDIKLQPSQVLVGLH